MKLNLNIGGSIFGREVFFCSTNGNVTDDIINNYIDNHIDAHKSDNLMNISLD